MLSRPRDVAWFPASYARDALARLSESTLPGPAAVRENVAATCLVGK